MGSSAWVRLFGLVLGVGAGCNIAGQPCGWLNLSACDAESTTSGAGGNMCAGFGGYGGEGGEGGAGGDDEGAGGDGSGLGGNFGVSVGVGGGSFGDAVGASVGAGGGDARPSGAEGHVARAPRHRGHRGGLGTVQQAGCPGPTGLKVFCKKPDWGVTCSDRCFAAGIGCVPRAVQPYKPTAGLGQLFSCNDLVVGYMCGYHYSNGDDCYFPFGRQGLALCSYSGND